MEKNIKEILATKLDRFSKSYIREVEIGIITACELWDLSYEELTKPLNGQDMAAARFMIAYKLREAGVKTSIISTILNRDRSSLQHGMTMHESRAKSDRWYKNTFRTYSDQFDIKLKELDNE